MVRRAFAEAARLVARLVWRVVGSGSGGMDTRGAMTIIKAQVPMSEMLTYEQHLTSATGGRGSYHMEYSHYDEVPGHLHAKIISASKAERGEAKEEED